MSRERLSILTKHENCHQVVIDHETFGGLTEQMQIHQMCKSRMSPGVLYM